MSPYQMFLKKIVQTQNIYIVDTIISKLPYKSDFIMEKSDDKSNAYDIVFQSSSRYRNKSSVCAREIFREEKLLIS